MHLPAKYRMYLTKRIAKQLCRCRDKIPFILEAQQRPQGLGLPSDQKPPQTTVDTCQAVLKGLVYLSHQWTQAEGSDKPSSEFCGAEPKTAMNTLFKALERELQRQESTDPVFFEYEHAHKPKKLFAPHSDDFNTESQYIEAVRKYGVYHETEHQKRRAALFLYWKVDWIEDWNLPPEVHAYCALLALQDYTMHRKWSTAEEFGEILSEKHLKETEDNFTAYVTPIYERLYDVLPSEDQMKLFDSR